MTTESIRQRKLQQIGGKTVNTNGSQRQSTYRGNGASVSVLRHKRFKRIFLALVIIVISLLIIFGLYIDSMPFVIQLATKLGYSRPQYAVIIDAGSTGTRVLAYKFHRAISGNKFFLDAEVYKEKKPGLSSYADTPHRGVESIQMLLNEARAFVPAEQRSSTPLILKATAGLRLLPAHKAEQLLIAVRDLFIESEFRVEADAVEIMDGIDEGIFSWFTVNFLLDNLSKSYQTAALDLGGGSTQVTFVPTDPEQVPIYEKYIHEVETLRGLINVFTHSYLGLGLMAARHAVFTHAYNTNDIHLESACVNPIIVNRTWIYNNVGYKITGKNISLAISEYPIVEFEACLELVKSITMPLVNPKPFTLKHHTIAAFSYYFDRAIESGLIDPFKGGEVTVEAFRKIAEEVCQTANDEQPFMCFDLTYISVLLHEGFGLSADNKIALYNKIDGHEVSWALGCAYHILTKEHKINI